MIPVTEHMIAAAARTHAEQEGYDWPEVSEHWKARYRDIAAAGLTDALSGHIRWLLSHKQAEVHAEVDGDGPLVSFMGFELAARDADELGTALVDAARVATAEAAAAQGVKR